MVCDLLHSVLQRSSSSSSSYFSRPSGRHRCVQHPTLVPMSNSVLFEVVADRLNDHCNHMIDMYILSGFLH